MTCWTRYIGSVTFAAFLLTGCGTATDENADEPQEDSIKEENGGNTSQRGNRNNRSDNKIRLMGAKPAVYNERGSKKKKNSIPKKKAIINRSASMFCNNSG
ncbi:hypothetical protein RCO48_29785 [Peribacillus frigoritolerans]|nr:hypothetical protein [Peribacillus frigoritolerans]